MGRVIDSEAQMVLLELILAVGGTMELIVMTFFLTIFRIRKEDGWVPVRKGRRYKNNRLRWLLHHGDLFLRQELRLVVSDHLLKLRVELASFTLLLFFNFFFSNLNEVLKIVQSDF